MILSRAYERDSEGAGPGSEGTGPGSEGTGPDSGGAGPGSEGAGQGTTAAASIGRAAPLRWTDLALARSSFLAFLVFALVGAAVVDDYGVSVDEELQLQLAEAAFEAVLGDDEALRSFAPRHHRLYGAAFEVPLTLVERLLGLEDSRAIFLSRHLLTHLFFLAGGLAASLLAYRLFHSRWLALFAMLVFVLHPRLFAHSFHNSKDIPFLAMFMIALYLVHRAFRRGGPGAFAVCGAGVGVLLNLRIMGVLLLAAVLALRALDFVQAAGRAERGRVLASAGVFVLATALTLYAVSPVLWSHPSALIEAFTTLSQHPNRPPMLFQGELIRWPEIPARYLPTWIAITTPPVVLVLGLAGAAAAVHRALTRPGNALHNTDARFGLLLVGCPVLTLAAVVVLNASVYDSWRHVYFLHAPFTLLAVLGLHRLALHCTRPALHTGVGVLAAAGVAWTVVEMILIHPHQTVYFNPLVDRRTPEHLRSRYDMTYWGAAHREGLEHLLRRFPSSNLPLFGFDHIRKNRMILPEEDRRRILFTSNAPDSRGFFMTDDEHDSQRGRYFPPFAPVVYTRKVYGSSILTVTALDPALVDEATAEAYRERYRSTRRRAPTVRSDFDLHLEADTLTWVKEPCRQADLRGSYFFLKIVPVDVGDLPRKRRGRGFDNQPFWFPESGVHVDGACMMRRPLPGYPIRSIDTGQRIDAEGYRYDRWRAEITLSPTGGVTAADVYREAYRAAAVRAPAERSYFDLYLDGDSLTWVRESCSPEDTRAGFFLHLTPVDPDALTGEDRLHGFGTLDFAFSRSPGDFPRIAGRFDGRCVASVPLPAYRLAGLRTGQITEEGERWQVKMTFPGGIAPTARLRRGPAGSEGTGHDHLPAPR